MPSDLVRIIGADQRRVVPWRNGRGTTTELAIEPPDAVLGGPFRWRLSAAGVVEDGPFSSFPGLARTLVLIDGPALHLTVDGQEQVLGLLGVARFDGGATTSARVPAGPVRDLNWMVATDLRHRGEVDTTGGGALEPGREWVLVPISGGAVVEGRAVGPLEVAVARGGSWRAEGPMFLGWILK